MNRYYTYVDTTIEESNKKLKTAYICDATINTDTNEAMIYIPTLDKEIIMKMKSDKLSDIGVYNYPKLLSSWSMEDKIIDRHGDKRLGKIISLDREKSRVRVKLIQTSKTIWVPFSVIHAYSYSCPNLKFPENKISKKNLIKYAKENRYLALTSNANYGLMLDLVLKEILLKNLADTSYRSNRYHDDIEEDQSDDQLEGPDDDYPDDQDDDQAVHNPGEEFTNLRWSQVIDE